MSRPCFPPVFYGKYTVDRLTPEQHDELLENGWFRHDVNVFSSCIKFMGNDWRSSVMLRVPLEHFTMKKRLRKLLRKNGELFRHEVRPFIQDGEKEALWQEFKRSVHQWGFTPQLDIHLLRDVPSACFCMWELCVYHGDRLVAFSVFDQGLHSIASQEAAYDPAYKTYSLGLYTMLLEIEHAKQEGIAYYYPGFFPKDVPMFEYKLRPGQVEFYRFTEKRWLPWEAHGESDWLMERVSARLDAARSFLAAGRLFVQKGLGVFYARPSDLPSASNYNMLLVAKNKLATKDSACLIAWDPALEQYRAFLAAPLLGAPYFSAGITDQHNTSLLDVGPDRHLGDFADLGQLLPVVQQALRVT